MMVILELRKTRKPVPVDVQCTMDDRVQQNQTQFDKNYVNVLWNAPLSPLVRF